jgi:tetratricopeptide (TPR) repeat protein
MEAVMSVRCGAWGKRIVAVTCLALALQVIHAQQKPAVSPASTLSVLLQNALDLEARGRPDLALQLWQQILLSDPNNTVALAGLARDFRLTGSIDKSNHALDRLRKIDPGNPEIAEIQALSRPSANGSTRASKNQPPSTGGANPAAASLPQPPAQQRRLRSSSQPVSGDGTQADLSPSGAVGPAGMGQAQPAPAPSPFVEMSLNPPLSLAADGWKGLVFSLMAGIHYQQALEQLDKIPPDIRRQLDTDVGFALAVASLYIEMGDSARAARSISHVDYFYLLHGAQMPAGMEIQYAWLLYNMQNDAGLYPVMMHLDQRTDLTAADRKQVNDIWANWAVGRAEVAMERNDVVHGVELLQAALEDYPHDLAVHKALAAAYARVGRAADALALYNTIPMTGASPGDYQGAISAAMSAGRMAQAETWLRDALARHSNDPRILELAARFEQARGDNARAADFWRAALAAMPPGSPLQNVETGLALSPDVVFPAPHPGDTKHLLNPQLFPLPAPDSTLSSLPAYPRLAPPGQTTPPAAIQPSSAADQAPGYEPPSKNPLPLPPLTDAPPAPAGQDAQPTGAAPQHTPSPPPPATDHFQQSMNHTSPAGMAAAGAN